MLFYFFYYHMTATDNVKNEINFLKILDVQRYYNEYKNIILENYPKLIWTKNKFATLVRNLFPN